MSKKKQNSNGIIYSTNPDFKIDDQEKPEAISLNPGQQKLKVRLDKRQRAGKAVTLVEGFSGNEKDLEDLGKKIKTFCGTGGSVKEGLIIIQGDQRDKVIQYLQNNGYNSSRKI
jgi:translation initiation factor 1